MLMLGFAMAASSAPPTKRRAAALVAAFRHRGRNHKMSPCDAGRAKIREPGFRPNVSSEADPPTGPVHGPRTRDVMNALAQRKSRPQRWLRRPCFPARASSKPLPERPDAGD